MNAGDSLSKDIPKWIILKKDEDKQIQIFETFTKLWNNRSIPTNINKLHILDPKLDVFDLLVLDKESKPEQRSGENLQLTYTISQNAWLGYFSPDECRGILNYQDGTFIPSSLPVGEIPFERDEI